MSSEYSRYPHRRCIECDSILDCPALSINDDGFGTIIIDQECPHKSEREKELTRLKNERNKRTDVV